jgi:uncharacterized protein (TIGR03000 family)
MSRHLFAVAALLGLPAFALAQLPPPPPPAGVGGFGGGVRSNAPLLPQVSPFMPQISPFMPSISPVPGGGVAGGFVRPQHRNPGFPFWVGNGGWFPFYGYDAPYSYPYPMTVEVPVFVPVLPPTPSITLSGESPATLVLEFPAAAEVWVNGKKGEGDAQTEWTLTSPELPNRTEYTFNVKARWKVNGKTFEYERSVMVAAGNRSKALVVSGTEIKE